MFRQFKHIDTAFQFIRLFAILFLVASTAITIYIVKRCTDTLSMGQQRIYLLYEGKLLEAKSIERHDSLTVEIRDHVKMFHYYFYTLAPDEQVNNRHLVEAMYLADSSAFREYKNLQEKGYYSEIISSNITESVLDYDSITINVTRPPYYFRYYGKLSLQRPTSVLTRSIITEGYIRMLPAVSDHNPHGMLIIDWKVLDNRTLSFEKK